MAICFCKRWIASGLCVSLKTKHAEFHKAASEVIKKADSGASVTVEVALGSNSEFSKASSAVVIALMSLKRKIF